MEIDDSKYFDLRVDNIKQIRGLITTFITLASAIIGFTIPVVNQSNIVKTPEALVGGLLELLIVVIYGLWHLKKNLEIENKELRELIGKKVLVQNKNRLEHSTDIIFGAFLIGLILIVFSLINFKYFLENFPMN